MVAKITVEDLNSQEQQVTLNGITFFIRFAYSTAFNTENWVMDILDQERNNLLVGKRITSTTNLTYQNLELTDLLGGYLFCVNTRGIREPINRDNFGSDKNYQIWYISNSEV